MQAIPYPAAPFVVAIPACNEAARIEPCLRALAAQRGARCDHVVVLLNNCTDGSATLLERIEPGLGVPLTIAVRDFPPEMADAGHARSHAMSLAASIAGPDGIIATTDADGVVASDWIANTRAAFAFGVEVVCGRAVIDPVEALSISSILHQDDARETAYGSLLDAIHALVDPDLSDPLPRHTEQSGASIAVTVAAYIRAGGMPPLPSGEDRGFVQALRAVDARIRHAPDVHVTVSGRLEGRAAGGMADTMARRMVQQDFMLDADLEAPPACLRRARLRARTRAVWGTMQDPSASWLVQVRSLAREAGLPAASVLVWLRTPYCGQAWNRIEAESPLLAKVPVSRLALDWHKAAAERILTSLRNGIPNDVADPAGIGPDARLHLA